MSSFRGIWKPRLSQRLSMGGIPLSYPLPFLPFPFFTCSSASTPTSFFLLLYLYLLILLLLVCLPTWSWGGGVECVSISNQHAADIGTISHCTELKGTEGQGGLSEDDARAKKKKNKKKQAVC